MGAPVCSATPARSARVAWPISPSATATTRRSAPRAWSIPRPPSRSPSAAPGRRTNSRSCSATPSPGDSIRRARRLLRFELDVLERRRPRVGVDQHQARLGHAGPDAARPDELVERTEPRPLVDELLDLVEHRLALLPVGLPRLLLEQRLDVGVGAAREGAVALDDVGDPGRRVAEVRERAEADPVELLAGPRGLEGGPLHGPELHPDPDRAEVADDRLAGR